MTNSPTYGNHQQVLPDGNLIEKRCPYRLGFFNPEPEQLILTEKK
jgi:hypothetical protein